MLMTDVCLPVTEANKSIISSDRARERDIMTERNKPDPGGMVEISLDRPRRTFSYLPLDMQKSTKKSPLSTYLGTMNMQRFKARDHPLYFLEVNPIVRYFRENSDSSCRLFDYATMYG